MPNAPTAAEVGNVVVKDLPAQDYLGQRFTSKLTTVGRDVQAAFAHLYGRIQEAGATPSGPPFLIASQPARGAMEVEVCAPCIPVPEPAPGMHAGRIESGRAAVLLHRGSYEAIGGAYEQVFEWIGRNGYSAAGAAREVYLNGPAEAPSPNDYLTEVVVPVR
jgi:effector-binding domain-containing protein